MQFFEKKISNLIENQFPSIYRDEGPVLVEFVKKYYEWMESEDNPLYHSRRMLEYRDVDSTIDSFLIHFKDKYLNNIQFDTAVETDRLVKHSLDLYRSKGTERAIDLFFRSIFGVPATVYYPARDIFRTSSGEWVEPKYLEVEYSENLKRFVGLQIEGINSGATAFVESYVRKRPRNSPFHAEIFYISAITGTFQTGEKIRVSATGEVGPIVVGSMNELTVTNGSTGYAIGDIVTVTSSGTGRDGKARVTGVESVSGKIDFIFRDGGWGYNEGSQVLISEKALTVSGMSNANGPNAFTQFETAVQPMATVGYNDFNGVDFAVGDVVFRMDTSTNSTFATATVIGIDPTSSTEGSITVTTGFERFDMLLRASTEADDIITTEDGFEIAWDGEEVETDGMIYKFSPEDVEGDLDVDISDLEQFILDNAVASANVTSLVDLTASANVMIQSANINITVANSFTVFSVGDEVYQMSGSSEVANGTIAALSYVGSTATIRVVGVRGGFMNGSILSRHTEANGYVDDVVVNIGLIDVSGDFSIADGNIIYGLSSNTTGEVTTASQGSGATFSVSNTYLYEETVALNTDIVGDYVAVQLDAGDYGFPTSGVEDINTILSDAFTYNIETYGRISDIIVTNVGTDYNFTPFVLIYEKDLYSYGKRDFIVEIENATGQFVIGEIVMQNNITKGMVKEGSNTSILYVRRFTFGEFDESEPVVGIQSGAQADIIAVNSDPNSDVVGLNALIAANTVTANGSVSALEVVDSGYSYQNGEVVSFEADGMIPGEATVMLLRQGQGDGYHRYNNSTLSGDKYLQDSNYYQEFSYEIRSSVVPEKYIDVLRNIIHIAGTKHFSKFVYESKLDAGSRVETTMTTEST